jgi:hypothetical protein
MQERTAQDQAGSEDRPGSSGQLRKPPEALSQLALKRGVPFRSSRDNALDLTDPEAHAELLAGKGKLVHQNDPAQVNARLHWYDELQGCAPLATRCVSTACRLAHEGCVMEKHVVSTSAAAAMLHCCCLIPRSSPEKQTSKPRVAMGRTSAVKLS